MPEPADKDESSMSKQHRVSARDALDAEIVVRSAGKPKFRVTVHDLSPQGCKITFVDRPSLDGRVWVNFEGLEALEGLVCWVEGIHAGVEFDRAIHPAVYELLLQRLR